MSSSDMKAYTSISLGAVSTSVSLTSYVAISPTFNGKSPRRVVVAVGVQLQDILAQ